MEIQICCAFFKIISGGRSTRYYLAVWGTREKIRLIFDIIESYDHFSPAEPGLLDELKRDGKHALHDFVVLHG